MTETGKRRVGGYEVLGPLGTSDQSCVFRARCVVRDRQQVEEGTEVALRTLHRVTEGSEACKRFEDKARTLLSLQHPHVVRYLDAFKWRANSGSGKASGPSKVAPCLIMERLEGECLVDSVGGKGRGLPAHRAAAVLEQSVAGMQYLEKLRVLPHPFNPTNVFLGRNDAVKLIGLNATRNGQSESASISGGENHFDYFSPDVVTGDEHGDARSAVFSFGVCMYQVLTGFLPFPRLRDDTDSDDCFKSFAAAYLNRWERKNGNAVKPHFRAEFFKTRPQTRHFFERCLEVSREARYPSFEAMGEDLAAVLSELRGAEVKPLPAPPRATPSGRASKPKKGTRGTAPSGKKLNKPVVGSLAALAAAGAVGLGVYLFWEPEEEAVPAVVEDLSERDDGVEIAGEPVTAPDVPGALVSTDLPIAPAVEEAAPEPPPLALLRIDLDEQVVGGPPVTVSHRVASQPEWTLVTAGLSIPPGRYELQFARPDYESVVVAAEVTEEDREVTVAGPRSDEWTPLDQLDILQKVETALGQSDYAALSTTFKDVPEPAFQWPPHADRFARVREQWSAELKRQEELAARNLPATLVVSVEQPAAGHPPVRVVYRPYAGSDWQAVSGPLALKPGKYYFRFTRSDYEPLLRLVTIPPGKSRLRVRGPRIQEWKPNSVLQELLDLEAAWKKGDMASLTKRFAKPFNASFDSPEHSDRLEQLRNRWFEKLVKN